MTDDTRKLLKLFGVSVTDFETEAEKLAATATQLPADATREQALALLQTSAELCREVNRRWLEITQHVFLAQERLLATLVAAARR